MTKPEAPAAREKVEILRSRLDDIRDERHFPAHMLDVHDEMYDLLDETAAILAALAPQWRPIETAPRNLKPFLAGWDWKDQVTFAYMNGSGDVFEEDDSSKWIAGKGPTHWMPKPAAPIIENA